MILSYWNSRQSGQFSPPLQEQKISSNTNSNGVQNNERAFPSPTYPQAPFTKTSAVDSRRAKKQKRKELRKLEKQRKTELRLAKKKKENELLNKIVALNARYPLHHFDYYSPTIEHRCKNKREFGATDFELLVIKYIRSHPDDMKIYEMMRANSQIQKSYENAFELEIEPHTTSRRILKRKRRLGQFDSTCTVIVSYARADKKLEKCTKYIGMSKLFEEVKAGEIRKR